VAGRADGGLWESDPVSIDDTEGESYALYRCDKCGVVRAAILDFQKRGGIRCGIRYGGKSRDVPADREGCAGRLVLFGKTFAKHAL